MSPDIWLLLTTLHLKGSVAFLSDTNEKKTCLEKVVVSLTYNNCACLLNMYFGDGSICSSLHTVPWRTLDVQFWVRKESMIRRKIECSNVFLISGLEPRRTLLLSVLFDHGVYTQKPSVASECAGSYGVSTENIQRHHRECQCYIWDPNSECLLSFMS